MKEHADEEKESNTIAFSTVSKNTIRSYLAFIKMAILVEDPPNAVENNVSFEPFQWLDTEEIDTPRAISHLEQELKKFGVLFGRNNYKMYDVHKIDTLLSFQDEKSGSLSGGTDLIIAPYGIAMESVINLSCVAFEFKTNVAVDQKELESFYYEAVMELIATNYHSDQMTLVVLTDLCTNNCILLTLTMESDKLAILKYSDVTLNQMAIFVHSHLQQNCFPIRSYRLPDSNEGLKESEIIMKAWKKARVTDITTSLEWEHFQEMLEDAPIGSKERAMIIRDHFRHHGFPESRYLNMFL
mmetsp:Transcript_33944/g.49304  ORF Transcript_33944/g.49304 Transcript_33944/m.49304 type:complete len:298 (-) Transcript_33944:160-1053(-)